MECPNCHLINPDTALRCDCGYDFASGLVTSPPDREDRRLMLWRQAAQWSGGCGCIAALLGGGLSLGWSYAAAIGGAPGPPWQIAVAGGAMAGGVIGLLLGLAVVGLRRWLAMGEEAERIDTIADKAIAYLDGVPRATPHEIAEALHLEAADREGCDFVNTALQKAERRGKWQISRGTVANAGVEVVYPVREGDEWTLRFWPPTRGEVESHNGLPPDSEEEDQ
jgi:hypothetical protein